MGAKFFVKEWRQKLELLMLVAKIKIAVLTNNGFN
jgi:hypothetical protein